MSNNHNQVAGKGKKGQKRKYVIDTNPSASISSVSGQAHLAAAAAATGGGQAHLAVASAAGGQAHLAAAAAAGGQVHLAAAAAGGAQAHPPAAGYIYQTPASRSFSVPNAPTTPGQQAFLDLYVSSTDSPPKPLDPNADTPDLFALEMDMKRFGVPAHVWNTNPKSNTYRAFVFLFVRRVPHILQKRERDALFAAILQPNSDQRNRLSSITRIMLNTYQGAYQDPYHVTCPVDWAPSYPFLGLSPIHMWNASGNTNKRMYLIFDHFLPCQGIQLSANCYLQAAITAQAYAVCRGNLIECGMTSVPHAPAKVDVSHYVLRAFCARRLYNRIMWNKGGSSMQVFEDLSALEDYSYKTCSARNFTMAKAFDYLASYGAGLVAKFHVNAAFRDDQNLSHTGTIKLPKDDKDRRLHAMVFVGVREDVGGTVWLLLQNWWKGKQFVEVTLEYLQSSGAILKFPQDIHTKFKEIFTVTHHNFTEANFADGGDSDFSEELEDGIEDDDDSEEDIEGTSNAGNTKRRRI
jgi:hypothetical protein